MEPKKPGWYKLEEMSAGIIGDDVGTSRPDDFKSDEELSRELAWLEHCAESGNDPGGCCRDTINQKVARLKNAIKERASL